MKQEIKYLCAALVVLFTITSCFNATTIPSELETMRINADADLQNVQLMRDYVNQSIFFIQSLEKKKGVAIEKFITEVMVRAQNYMENNEDETFMQVDLARINFQAASYQSEKQNFIKAASFLQRGIEQFADITNKHPNDVFIRAYKIINVLNIPAMFQDKEVIWNDLSFVIQQSTDMFANRRVLENKLAGIKEYRTENTPIDVEQEFRVVLTKVVDGSIDLYSDDIQRMKTLRDFRKKINTEN